MKSFNRGWWHGFGYDQYLTTLQYLVEIVKLLLNYLISCWNNLRRIPSNLHVRKKKVSKVVNFIYSKIDSFAIT